MGATPLYLAIILARANAYSHASVTLHLSGTVASKILNRIATCMRVFILTLNFSLTTQAHQK